MKKIELLSPAGSVKNMKYAFAYGADAVYAGQPRYSLRVRKNEFNHLEKMAEAISIAHAQNKKFLVASNIAAHNNKVQTYLRDMEAVIAMKPDALIIATEWNEFRSPDFEELGKRLNNKILFDGRNLFDLDMIRETGFKYYSIGRPAVTE